MVKEALYIIAAAFGSCVKWFDQVISSLDAGGIIIACVLTAFAIGIILEPLRGSMDMHMNHYTKNSTSSKKSNIKKKGG